VWRRVAEIKPGDRVPLMLNNLVGEPNEVTLPPLGELYWTADRRTRVPRRFTPELGEFLGYFMGDGSLHAKGLRMCVTDGDVDVMERLLALGVVPIINENDAVATDEIRFGDNDRLAALVAHLAVADALVLLSDVEGVYDGDPRRAGSRLITDVRDPGDLVDVDVRSPATEGIGTGGMGSKLEAAGIAVQAGVPVLLASAARAAEALAGGPVGTFFAASGRRPTMRLFWLRHASSPRGRLCLDYGAVTAVVARRTSLLAAGITSVSGEFVAEDPVDIVDPAGRVVARGLAGYDADELAGMLGRRSADLPEEYRRAVVHRDDMVLL